MRLRSGGPPLAADSPLTPRQRRAAQMLGEGVQVRDVARQVERHPRSVSKWRKNPEFEELVRQARLRLLEENPTPTATLEAALSATRRDGGPDWQSRITAARALLNGTPAGETPEEQVRETRIYIGGEDDGGARPDPRTRPEYADGYPS